MNHAQDWITHLGNLGAPLTGVVLADYLVLQRQQLDVEGLFDPRGRYSYLKGVNVPALAGVVIGMAAYYAVPASWVKLIWGLSLGAGAYLVLSALRTAMDTDASATVRRPSSPS